MTVVVSQFEDIEANGATLSDKDTIARCLRSRPGRDELVAFVPRWLAEEKDIESVIHEFIEHETGKAWLVDIGGLDVWLPKSVVVRFVPAGDADIQIPQRGLGEFARGGQA